ncbi:DUF4010 domain-containing protein [Pantoea sp. 18069]|uniref:DUF4010 domain-containing protein n=1 Tax=Pantoea sp. 18069 TaxID=2681415 RepID=UPI0013591EE7|nr:DUF4010 domain-containing protein [Pantoea sp. 18069]
MLQAWNGSAHWIVSLGVGLLIGVASERRETAQRSSAGVRTHALAALLGCGAWTLGPGPFMAALLVVGALVVAAYWHSARHDPGLTGEVALVFSMALGALSHESTATAAGLGVVGALLVHAKGAIQRWSRELLHEQELRNGLLLAAAALVVMPLLPQQPVDPWGVLQLATLWRVVVLVMAVGMLGHVLTRTLGARWGLPVAGFFSGFASSTAAVAHLGQQVKDHAQHWASATACAMLSQLASLLLFAAALWLALAAGVGLWRAPSLGTSANAQQGQAFHLSQALLIAAIMALMALLAAWLQRLFGDAGVLAAAVVVALAEVHAAAASIAQLQASDSLALPTAQWGVVAVLAASAAAKSLLAFTLGGWRYGLGTGLGLLAMTGTAGLALWWQS